MKKKTWNLWLALALLLLCCGCQPAAEKTPPGQELVGEWVYELDMTDYFKEKLESNYYEGSTEYFQLQDFIITVDLVFEEDGEYSLSTDEEALRESVLTLREDIKRGSKPFLEHLMAQEGIAAEDVEPLLMEHFGWTMDDFAEQMANDLGDPDYLTTDMASSLKRFGTYVVQDEDEVKLTSQYGERTVTYVVEDTTLTLTNLNIEHFEDPTVFTSLAAYLPSRDDPSGGEGKEPSPVTPDDNREDAQQSEQPGASEVPEQTEGMIRETVLVDEAGVKITAKGLTTDGILGPKLDLLIENDSGKDLTFDCGNASINGYMVGTMMSIPVANGEKTNDSLTFLDDNFEACGIHEIADIEISFHISNTADWETYLDTDAVQIKTAIADTFAYTYDDSGDLAYEGNDIKIVVKGLAEADSISDSGIVVYIENNGDKAVTVRNRDVSINGVAVDAMLLCDVAAGKRAVDTITFMGSALEESGITVIGDVELSFRVLDLAEWEIIADTDVVTVSF